MNSFRCTGLTFESGWSVDIKMRKAGSSAGTSDVVRVCYGVCSIEYFD